MHKAAIISRVAAVTGMFLFMLLAPLSGAMAIEDGGIGGKPANPRPDNPRSESIFVYELEPGQSYSDEVQVINNTGSPKTLLVYSVDSQVASGGAFSCAQKIDEPLSVGTWIKLAKTQVTLQPNSFENVAFTVTVPQNASAGESNGCIVVQDTERSTSTENGGITLSFRTAIRVAVTIPGEITKDLAFTGLTAKSVEGSLLRFSTGLKNNGNVSVDTDLAVNLKTIFGTTVKSVGGTFPVLARSDATFNFETDEPFWGGWYIVNAQATYSPDTDKSLGEGGSKKAIGSSDAFIFVAPKPAALAIELLAVAIIAGSAAWLTVRKLKLATLAKKSVVHTVRHGETLNSLAKSASVKWQVIAKVNRLKAPYHIEPGQKLKIPRG